MAQIPKTGTLSLSNVRSILGESTLDLKSLSTSLRINKWAKYKPVDLPSGFQSLDETFTMVDPFDNVQKTFYRWQGKPKYGSSSDYRVWLYTTNGLSIPVVRTIDFNSLSVGVRYAIEGGYNWDYTEGRPSGGANSWYRLSDFRGYKDSSQEFFQFEPSFASPTTVNKLGTAIVDVYIDFGIDTGEDDFTMDDFPVFKGMYFAAALFTTSGVFRGEIFSDQQIIDGAGGIHVGSFNFSGMDIGTYHIYFYITNKVNLAFPLYTSINTPAKGIINVISSFPYNFSFETGGYMVANDMRPIGNLNYNFDPPYLALKTNRTFVLGMKVSNLQNQQFVISRNDFIMKNYFTKGSYTPRLFNSSGVEVNNISIPSNTDVDIYLSNENWWLDSGGNEINPPNGEIVEINMDILYKNQNLAGDTIFFCYDGTNGYIERPT